MSRHTGPNCRFCRREGTKLFLKGERCTLEKCGFERRSYAPGQHGQNMRRRQSEYSVQLRAKQKLARIYGVREGQFRSYYKEATRITGVSGENLLRLLESRLDSVVYRLGFGSTRAQARQLVTHGHINVNGSKLSIPSAHLKVGAEIAFSDKGKKSEYVKILAEEIGARDVPGWLEVNRDALTGKMIAEPGAGDYEAHFNPNAVVEHYSR